MPRLHSGSILFAAGTGVFAACFLWRRRRRRQDASQVDGEDEVEVLITQLTSALERRGSSAKQLSASSMKLLEASINRIGTNCTTTALQRGLSQTVVDTIGWTPLVRLDPHKLGFPQCNAEIFAKLEFQNPGGSVKDRIAAAMIDEAEKAGKISPGKSVLIEATSGNTGIGLAMVAAARGYKLIVTMPRLQAMTERYIIMRAFGAEVALSDPKLKTQGFLDLAEEIARKTPDSYLLRQFQNPANPTSHMDTTGPEIWAQCGGDIDALVAGVGTGGTVVGVGQFLKKKNPSCAVLAVEPASSRVLQGHSHRVHALTGIGTGLQVPMVEQLEPGEPFVEGKGRGIIDEFVCAEDGDSLDMALTLARTQGILVGPTSGATVACACHLGCRPEMQGKRIVAVCASSAVRYMQHPLFKTIRDEANSALSDEATESTFVPTVSPKSTLPEKVALVPRASSESTLPKEVALSWQTFDSIEKAILQMVRDILKVPMLQAHEPMIDYGATSLTAMMILGKVRDIVRHQVESMTSDLSAAELSSLSGLHGMKVAILKESLWGSVHELTLSVLGLDDNLAHFPKDCELRRKIVVTYCGG